MVVVDGLRLHPLPINWCSFGLICNLYLLISGGRTGGGFGFEYDGSSDGGGTGMARRWALFAPITFPSISIFAAAVSGPEKSGKLNSKPDVPG